jgi:hypothetical protein
MIPIGNISYFIALNPTSATAGATLTSAIFDMQDYHYAVIEIEATTADNATHSPTVAALQTANVTNSTSFANDSYFTGGAAGGFTIPNSPTATTSKPYMVWEVDWRSRPRYGQVLYSPQTTQTVSIRVLKYRADRSPVSNVDKNVTAAFTG